ncbi:MAG TPA: hypothetical protein VFI41_12560 [Gemmatimonadales bacterium]|nr:hypothetical protein [Gemmatimonadales bacterium]
MVGNWTDWKVTRWDGSAYVCERVRAYRSRFFGFIREEREQKRFPGLDETTSLAAANGETLIPASEHYTRIKEVVVQREEARKMADVSYREAQKIVQRAGALKAENDLLRANIVVQDQRTGELKAENDLLRANNAGLKRRADEFERAYTLEKQAYEELLAAVKAGEAMKPKKTPAEKAAGRSGRRNRRARRA